MNSQSSQHRIIGIDFGASTCKMAWYDPRKKHPVHLRSAEKSEYTPTIVYYGEPTVFVGALADQKLLQDRIGHYGEMNIKESSGNNTCKMRESVVDSGHEKRRRNQAAIRAARGRTQ